MAEDELVEKMQQKLVSVNSLERILAEWEIADLQSLLDDEKIKLSDENRVGIISSKESLEKALKDLIELISILVKKEEYAQEDFNELVARCGLSKVLRKRAEFVCLRARLNKKE